MTGRRAVETVGERLRRLRLAQGLSQRSIAQKGVTYAYVSRLEAGTRTASITALRKLAARLHVTPLLLEMGTEEIVCPHCGRQPSPSNQHHDPRLGGRTEHHHA
jgi:transcriptional regulator with XRE-family HTH domain